MTFKIDGHFLIPKHMMLSQEQVEQLLKKYGLRIEQLPKILKTDPAIKDLKTERDNVVKIVRESLTAGKTIYYRRVV